MSTTSVLRHARFARPLPNLRGVLDMLAAADARRRERHDLAALDDHLLRDIGITRSDVAAELRRPW
jgi:uncharacterized protein YjiS (DUF1127 family)